MSERTIDELIAASSLGTPEVVAVRATADPVLVERVLSRVRQLDQATILDHTGAPMNPPSPGEACDHGVVFDEVAWRADPSDVQKRWPRLMGVCPKGCGYRGIAYASYLHYIAGDW